MKKVLLGVLLGSMSLMIAGELYAFSLGKIATKAVAPAVAPVEAATEAVAPAVAPGVVTPVGAATETVVPSVAPGGLTPVEAAMETLVPSSVVPGAVAPTCTCTTCSCSMALRVKKDQEFTFKLPSNPTTGYSWSVSNFDSELLELVEKKFERETEAVMPGMGGWDVFTFKALKSGKTTSITVGYGRAWEKDKPAAEQRIIKVDIE